MDRTEATGLGIAFAGHAALFAVLALGFATVKLPVPKNEPIEVSFVEEVGLATTAPVPSTEEPAPLSAPEEGPPAPAAVAPMPEPLPVPRVEPAPTPRVTPAPPPPRPAPAPKAVQRPQPPQPAPPQTKAAQKPAPKPAAAPSQQPGSAAKPTGRLNNFRGGFGVDTQGEAATPPAQRGDPKVEASLVAEVRRKVKPHWQRNVPTGADAEQLRTELVIALSRNGAITGMRVAGTTGVTPSNRPQVALHQERARKAVTLAAPFDLPDHLYENWKELAITLDLRLSQ